MTARSVGFPAGMMMKASAAELGGRSLLYMHKASRVSVWNMKHQAIF